ncbi:MAG: SDR family oxidoreductase [Chromatiales bacterium]|jgi:NAD(P)-dependent dehydrogenase (short-subunit alcohol dehydrogenase family)|nr:SDR family oxidoreductase [Chromatiales bacterium]
MNRLEGKTCLITGAGSGIGRASALAFAAEGAEVIAMDMSDTGLQEVVAQAPTIRTLVCNVTRPAEVAATMGQLQSLDVLFNCAGIVAVGAALECTLDQWHQSFDVNVHGICHMVQGALPIMLAHGGGSIINMASVISSIGGAPDRFAYGATKGAVLGLTKSVARDYADQGIRCNAICPSAVETPSMTARIEALDDPPAARELFSSRQPVGRMGTPIEIAHLAVYLASDESRFTTGSAIVIDGGAKL